MEIVIVAQLSNQHVGAEGGCRALGTLGHGFFTNFGPGASETKTGCNTPWLEIIISMNR